MNQKKNQKMIKFHNLEQQTPEWFELKNGHPLSASKAQAIATAGKGLETLVMDYLTKKYSSGEDEGFRGNKETARGNELEPIARSIYELDQGVKVEEVGFITNSKISDMAGVSPDGLVSTDGMLEIKALSDDVYTKKLAGFGEKGEIKIDSGHLWQMQMQMLFAERKWNDYMVYNPNFTKSFFITRVSADPVQFQKLLTGIKIGEALYKKWDALIRKAINLK